MAVDSSSPGSAKDWLRHARSDLELACIDQPEGVLLETLCFHAQQATEKALKAVFVFLETDFPRTHNIRTLLDLLSNHIGIPQVVDASAGLTDYAVESRYPMNTEPVDEEEYQHAIGLAKLVVHWAETLICENIR
ncbi:MAG: HEPN domain-containing protein [Gemmatimonadetes bacterium]|nr:HEPN domain-containing protein [Gemmatimonadota bacterium]